MKLKRHLTPSSLLCATLALSFTLSACDPVPSHTLTTDEKIADLYWIYSQFGENYAPLEMKQSLHHFSYDTLKTQYVELATQTKTNDEFYDLMFKFVAQFQDAHTSAALTNSSLPNRASVAFLGFNGFRKGDYFVVKELLPTVKSTSSFPIKVGDVITKINGKSMKDAVTEQLEYRNLGSDEANLTALMPRVFTRISTLNGAPKETDAVLTVERSDETAQEKALAAASTIADPLAKAAAIKKASDAPEKKVLNFTIPWVVKDLNKFKKEQSDAVAEAAAEKKKNATPDEDPDSDDSVKIKTAHPENFLMTADDGSQGLKFSFIGFDGRVQMPFDLIQRVTANLRTKIADGFRFLDNYASWKAVAPNADEAPKTSTDNLKANRVIMKDAMFITAADAIFPAYMANRDLLDKDGNKTGVKKPLGYIYIDSFAPSAKEAKVLAEVKQTLATFQNWGVKDIIIDTINNGGGSLSLGMKIAQALSNKKVEMPKMQVRLSDTWLDEFETEIQNPESDAEGEYARRTLTSFRDQQKAGKRLSDPLTADSILAPFQMQPNDDLNQPFHVVLLVNEMCASMCDIFAGIMQDNKMATLVGSNTMGAGGNVVNHTQAPNSHLDVRQTESLIVRADGSYLENAGVKPDVAIAVNESSDAKYGAVILKAISLLTQKKK